jgi:hypothetical protein
MKNDKNKNVQKEREKAEHDAQVARNKADRATCRKLVKLNAQLAKQRVYGIQSRNGVNTYGTILPAITATRFNSDSLNAVNNAKIIEAAKTFIADYGDMLSLLAPNERIIVTNRGTNENNIWLQWCRKQNARC